MDDAIREVHGVECRVWGSGKPTSILIREDGQSVVLDANYGERAMTAWQARYLAAKLYRLSRRIRQRQEAAASSLIGMEAA